MTQIDVAAVQASADEGLALIDVRSPGEFARVHAQGAINLPLERVSVATVAQIAGATSRVVLLCQSGARAAQAAAKLADSELAERVLVLTGGTAAWQAAGAPVVRGRGAIAIDRQVRIAAGFLVAAGAAVGYWLHPAGIVVSGCVGLGLMVAGITNTCAMAAILARMPWNAGSGGGSAGCTPPVP
ncbi:MAG: rhodanese-like domain-containing protein [Planctomycetota bacterium]|jgi:rhodanese-related sulfurtransferase